MNIRSIRNKEEIKTLDSEYCVYFLTDHEGEIVYIGKSAMQTLGRIAAHKRDKEFSRAFFVRMKTKEEMDEREKEMIFDIRPTYNGTIAIPEKVAEETIRKGLITKKELLARMEGIKFYSVSAAARKNMISPVFIGRTEYWPEKLIGIAEEHIRNMKSCPLSVTKKAWDRIRNEKSNAQKGQMQRT